MNRLMSTLLLAGLVMYSGCVSVPSSPESRFYLIAPVENSQTAPMALTSDFAVAVAEIQIPDLLNRPHIVVQGPDHQIQFSQFDRWAEPLEDGLTRSVKENLSTLLPRAKIIGYPVDFPTEAAFRVEMQLVRLSIDLSGEVILSAQWAVVDIGYPKNTIVEKFEFHQPFAEADYAQAVQAVNTAVGELSMQIAKAIYHMSGAVHP